MIDECVTILRTAQVFIANGYCKFGTSVWKLRGSTYIIIILLLSDHNYYPGIETDLTGFLKNRLKPRFLHI